MSIDAKVYVDFDDFMNQYMGPSIMDKLEAIAEDLGHEVISKDGHYMFTKATVQALLMNWIKV